MAEITKVGPHLGVRPTCEALGVAPATYYRHQRTKEEPRVKVSPRALTSQERQEVLDVLHEPRFVDVAPAEVFATLLDEGRYLGSERTMYRVLAANREVRERRDQLRHPHYAAPELMATGPNELWSWDITSAVLAERLIGASCQRQGIGRDQLTLHADRGSSMRSKTVALLLSDLGVTKTHSRPYTSTDNPPVRLHPAQPWLLWPVLRLVQPSAPPRFSGVADAPRCPLRAGRATIGRAGSGAHGCLCGPSGAVPKRHAHTGGPAGGRMDQQAEGVWVCRGERHRDLSRNRRSQAADGKRPPGIRGDQAHREGADARGCSLNSKRKCLIFIDRFRLPQ